MSNPTGELLERMRRKLWDLRADMWQTILDEQIALPPIKMREENGARIYEHMDEHELLDTLVLGFRTKIRELEQ